MAAWLDALIASLRATFLKRRLFSAFSRSALAVSSATSLAERSALVVSRSVVLAVNVVAAVARALFKASFSTCHWSLYES